MNDGEFIATVIEACRKLPNAEAVALGGSRSRGDHRPDSDWDFAVYYRGSIDAGVFERLGWPGTVFQPLQWGQVMLTGELATGTTLWGSLRRPAFPEALRRTAPHYWLDRADAELSYADYWATSENPISASGALARAVLSAAHARQAARGVWALNEKRLVQAAGLVHLGPTFAALGRTEAELRAAVRTVRESVAAIRLDVPE